jgi:hypothetical protein
MTRDQEASVLANLETTLLHSPPPLPRRRWGRKLLAITALVVIGFGYYVYSSVANVDTMAERGLRLWDRTEVLIQTDPQHRSLTSCNQARDAATKLQALQDDKLGNLSERLVAMRELAAKAKRCTRELAR